MLSPTKINKYNVYAKGNRLLGRGDEMELPKFETSGETVSGAGILGRSKIPPWAISPTRPWTCLSGSWTRTP